MSTRPSWPSLYNWAIEVFPIEGRDPVQPEAVYLYDHNGANRRLVCSHQQLTHRRHLPLHALLDPCLLYARIHSGRLIRLPEPYLPARADAPTGVTHSLEAADQLAQEGVKAEIINLRSIRPLDIDTIIRSVKKTNR